MDVVSLDNMYLMANACVHVSGMEKVQAGFTSVRGMSRDYQVDMGDLGNRSELSRVCHHVRGVVTVLVYQSNALLSQMV